MDCPRRRLLLAAPALGLSAPVAAQAPALRIVIPFGPGGPNEAVASALLDPLRQVLGREVALYHRPSARGAVAGTDVVARAAPDGGTLLLAQPAHLTQDVVFPSLPYDPIESFAPVSIFAETPLVLLVPGDGPRSLTELALRLRRGARMALFGSGGPATGPHLAALMLLELLQAEATHQPFPGLAPARAALAAGRLDFLVDTAASAVAVRTDARVRPLVVLGPERVPALPGVPVLQEVAPAGATWVPDVLWQALLAPAATPEPVLATLNAAVDRALAHAGVAERLAALGSRPRGGLDVAALRAFLAEERRRLRPQVLRAALAE